MSSAWFVPCSPPGEGSPAGAASLSQLLSLTSQATLVLPSVSVGNIGQLAIDALITSYSAVKLGYIRSSPFLLPVVANDAAAASTADVTGRLSLPVELFYSTQQRVLLLQQRAPAVTGLNGAYASALRSVVVEQLQVRDVVLLTSASSHRRDDAQIQHDHEPLTLAEGQEGAMPSQADHDGLPATTRSAIHFFASQQHPAALKAAAALRFLPLAQREPPPPPPLPSAADSDDVDFPPSSSHSSRPPPLTPLYPFSTWFQGGGVGPYLWPLLDSPDPPARPVPAIALLVYAVEGDNAREALTMARAVDALLRAMRGSQQAEAEVGWRTPLSWQWVFGREPQPEIYL